VDKLENVFVLPHVWRKLLVAGEMKENDLRNF